MLKVKEMLGSKKFKVTLFSALAVVCSVMADKINVQQGLDSLVVIVATYLGAQGLADFGKAKHVESAENKTEK
jgi:hypothetical protein